MHWTDGYKTEGELREAMKKLSKDGVLRDGERIRVPLMLQDGAATTSDGMPFIEVATAVARGPLFCHLSDNELKREAVRSRFGDGAVDGAPDEDVDVIFTTLRATSAGDLARQRSIVDMRNAWRGQ